jgi:hypothetical protein
MNRSLVAVILGGLAGAGLTPAPAVAQPVTAEVALAAELEIVPVDPRIGILAAETWTYTHRDPAADSDAVTARLEVWAGQSAVIRRLWGRVRAVGELSSGELRVIARSTPQFELVNGSDSTVRLETRVHVPDVSLLDSPGDYFYRASTEDQTTQIVRVEQLVSLLTGSLEGVGEPVLTVSRWTRPPDRWELGPVALEIFGVPFFRTFFLDVPPSFRTYETEDEIIIEIAPYGVRLVMEADILALAGGSASEPLVVDSERINRERRFPPLAFAPAPLARLCRARGSNASPTDMTEAPVCTCLRDDVLRSQRCSFSFGDLMADAALTSPLKPGEIGDAAWTFRPAGGADGFYEVRTSMLTNGKWVPVAGNGRGKSRGKYLPGRPIRQRIRFTAPEKPTILRTVLRRWPDGAKKPIESTSDVFVALRKPRPDKQEP